MIQTVPVPKSTSEDLQITIGIDVSKEHLDAARYPSGETIRVTNTQRDHAVLLRWINKGDYPLDAGRASTRFPPSSWRDTDKMWIVTSNSSALRKRFQDNRLGKSLIRTPNPTICGLRFHSTLAALPRLACSWPEAVLNDGQTAKSLLSCAFDVRTDSAMSA